MSDLCEQSGVALKKVVKEETMQDSITYFCEEFASGKFVSYSRFKGENFIHIRVYENIGGRLIPTKRGASFTPGRLRVLLNKTDEIDEQLKLISSSVPCEAAAGVQYKTHLGAGIFAAIDSKFNGVNLRRYWAPEGQAIIVATRNGIFLSAAQWLSMKEKLNELLVKHPELAIAETCFHQNQLGLLDCHECLPFGWMLMDMNGM